MLIQTKGYFLVFMTAIISGFSIFINKYSVSVINPYIFTFLKNALVAAFLCAVVLTAINRQELKSLGKKQWGLLFLIGLIGGSIPFLLFFKGLLLTSAAGASFIHKTMFLWVIVLATIFLKEKITRVQLFAGLMLLGGN